MSTQPSERTHKREIEARRGRGGVVAKRAVTHSLRAFKQQAALLRQANAQDRTIEQQLKLLDERPGNATRERAKLARRAGL